MLGWGKLGDTRWLDQSSRLREKWRRGSLGQAGGEGAVDSAQGHKEKVNPFSFISKTFLVCKFI
jgi:hypothetical protein